MKSFKEIIPELSAAHVRLIELLLVKGISFAGSAVKNGDCLLELKSEGNEIVINPSAGRVELFTEFIDRSDPTDVGHHVWMIYSDATGAEIITIVDAISAIIGDN